VEGGRSRGGNHNDSPMMPAEISVNLMVGEVNAGVKIVGYV
jgi:hypothetical protein